MEQEDYLKRQIDQLGQVLGKILTAMTGLWNRGQIGSGIEAADQAFKTETGMTLSGLASISPEKLIVMLQETGKFSPDNLEQLAGILLLFAEELDRKGTDSEKKQIWYRRSLAIYEHLEKTSSTYSFDRHLRIEKIKKLT